VGLAVVGEGWGEKKRMGGALLKYEELAQPLLEADSSGIFYRFMNKELQKGGSFFK